MKTSWPKMWKNFDYCLYPAVMRFNKRNSTNNKDLYLDTTHIWFAVHVLLSHMSVYRVNYPIKAQIEQTAQYRYKGTDKSCSRQNSLRPFCGITHKVSHGRIHNRKYVYSEGDNLCNSGIETLPTVSDRRLSVFHKTPTLTLT